MTPPPGLSLPSPQHVCKLQRSLYGFRQAGRQWYAKLSTFLLSNKYSISVADHPKYIVPRTSWQSRREGGVLEIPHRLEIRVFHCI